MLTNQKRTKTMKIRTQKAITVAMGTLATISLGVQAYNFKGELIEVITIIASLFSIAIMAFLWDEIRKQEEIEATLPKHYASVADYLKAEQASILASVDIPTNLNEPKACEYDTHCLLKRAKKSPRTLSRFESVVVRRGHGGTLVYLDTAHKNKRLLAIISEPFFVASQNLHKISENSTPFTLAPEEQATTGTTTSE